jgi:hypothetical protein
MNSGRANTVEQFEPWTERAKRRFFGATIHGSGRYVVAIMDHQNVYAFETHTEAVTFMAGHPQYRLYDLNEEPVRPCRTIPDAYDVDELRRERREQRAAAQQGIAEAKGRRSKAENTLT